MFITLIIIGSIWLFVGITLLTYNVYDDNRKGFPSSPWVIALGLFWPWFLTFKVIELVQKLNKEEPED
jgi:hypothetical protein